MAEQVQGAGQWAGPKQEASQPPGHRFKQDPDYHASAGIYTYLPASTLDIYNIYTYLPSSTLGIYTIYTGAGQGAGGGKGDCFAVSKADLALATVPGMEFDPAKRFFTAEELKPQPIIKKRKKVPLSFFFCFL